MTNLKHSVVITFFSVLMLLISCKEKDKIVTAKRESIVKKDVNTDSQILDNSGYMIYEFDIDGDSIKDKVASNKSGNELFFF